LTDFDIRCNIDEHRYVRRRRKGEAVPRVQLALNVDDLERSVAFYSKLFDAAPAKERPGYANFALDDPALKLVLIENPGHGGTLNHLGVEVGSSDDVTAADHRLRRHDLETRAEEGVDCCYALQDKVWVDDPDGAPWEVYTVLHDSSTEVEASCCAGAGAGCC
jgi:catechol 2,3-dioxygenase-like lactoylglutathione lyase family enzyme